MIRTAATIVTFYLILLHAACGINTTHETPQPPNHPENLAPQP